MVGKLSPAELFPQSPVTEAGQNWSSLMYQSCMGSERLRALDCKPGVCFSVPLGPV
jgi:hypothetical protein